MATLHMLDRAGGFTAIDTSERIAAYAEPGSTNAARAAADNGRGAGIVRDQMIAVAELAAWRSERVGSKDTGPLDEFDRSTQRIAEGRTRGCTVARDEDDARIAEVREGRQEARYHATEEQESVQQIMQRPYDPNRAGSFRELQAVARERGVDPTRALELHGFERTLESATTRTLQDRSELPCSCHEEPRVLPQTVYSLSGIARDTLSGKLCDTLAERTHHAVSAEYERLGEVVNIGGKNYEDPERRAAYSAAMAPLWETYERGQQGPTSRVMSHLDGDKLIRSGQFSGRGDDAENER